MKKFLLYSFIFIFSLAVLIAYLVTKNVPFTNITPDGKLYYNMAENLIQGNGLINQVRLEEIIVPPFFALILSPFVLFFDSETPFFYFQYILYGLNGALTAWVAKKFFRSDLSALIVGAFYSIQPVLFRNGPQFLLTETIFITLILLSVLFLKKWIDTDGDWKIGGWFIFYVSLTLLFRPHLLFIFVLFIIFILYFWYRKGRKPWMLFFFVVPVLILSLNGLYNQKLHGEFVPLENYSGQNMYIANNPETEVKFFATTVVEDFVEPYYFTLSELSLSEKSEILQERAVEYIIDEPFEMLSRVIQKMILFFQPVNTVDLVSIVISVIGLICAIVFDKERRVLHIAMLIYILGFTSFTALGLLIGGQRYRAPLIPVYLIYVGYLWILIRKKLTS